MGALLILTTLLTAPAVVRNLYLGAGPIGYRYASVELTQRIAELGQLKIAQEISMSIFYQLSYVFIGSWGLLGVLITLSILRWNRFSGELQACVTFVISAIGGLIAMSAVGMTSFRGLGYWMPNGRYEGILLPAILFFGICLLMADLNRRERGWMILTTLLLTVIAVVATPLHVLAPYTFINNMQLALIAAIIDAGQIAWRFRYEPFFYQRVWVGTFFGAIGVLWAISTGRRVTVIAILAAVVSLELSVSLAEHRYVRMLGTTQAPLNDVIRFVNRHADNAAVVDSPQARSFDHIGRFWGDQKQNLKILVSRRYCLDLESCQTLAFSFRRKRLRCQ